MSRVTLTINLELETPSLPSSDALNAAMQRAEEVAARVFVCGDLGGKMHLNVDQSPSPIAKTCEAVNVLPGRIHATVGRKRRKAHDT
jgi:hypothetical protein